MELISDANPENEQPDEPLHNVVPFGDNPVEIETEWELLEGGRNPKQKVGEDEIEDPENPKRVIRRYEFYEYTGIYDVEHEPVTLFTETDLLLPPDGERGKFLSANMVAAVIQNAAAAPIPEPASGAMMLSTGLVAALRSRRRRGD